jgi:hypothetical protein
MQTWAGRATLGALIVMGLLPDAPAADPPAEGSPDQDPDPARALPFAFTVKTSPWGGLGKTDFPKPFFLVDKEMALISCDMRGSLLKGADVDHLKDWARIGLTFEMLRPRTDNACVSGAWYDRETKTIYAVIHCEVRIERQHRPSNPGWCRKKTALVKSLDQGKTWQGAGDLLTAPHMDLDYDWLMSSGADFEAGPADFEMYVDERGGYAYITSWNSYVPKGGGLNGFHMFSEVARCALSDKLASGKWFKFRDGKWEEPGLGGKASRVGFDRRGIYGCTIYSTFLKRYLRVGIHIGIKDDRGMPGYGFNDRSLYISSCTDLGKQDWSPMAKLLDDPAAKHIMAATSLTNGEGTDPYTCGDTLRVYNYWEYAARRLDVTLKKEGTTPSTYFPAHDSYGYQPRWESGDPIESRRTRIVGALVGRTSAVTSTTSAWPGPARPPATPWNSTSPAARSTGGPWLTRTEARPMCSSTASWRRPWTASSGIADWLSSSPSSRPAWTRRSCTRSRSWSEARGTRMPPEP